MSVAEPKCLFCGGVAETDEHVIPDWMQRDFDLKHMKLILPNRSEFKYLHAKVPACSIHNGLFSSIEDKIKNKTCTHDEFYLWSLKVYAGLMFLDSNLKADIKDPASGPLIPFEFFEDDIGYFRQIFKIWATGEYQFIPSPLGSVFSFPALTPNFDFIHSYAGRSLGVSLGDRFLCTLFYDQGHAMRANLADNWNPPHLSDLPPGLPVDQQSALLDQRRFVTQRIWLCETSYWAHRLELSTLTISTDNQLVLPLHLNRPTIRPHDLEEYRKFCLTFGIELVGETDEYFSYRLSS